MTIQDFPTVKNLIAGQWTEGSGNDEIQVHNPSTAEAITQFRDSTDADVDRAVAAATAAQPEWAALTPGERSSLLHKVVDEFAAHIDELIDIEVANAGKPVTAVREGEFADLLDAIRSFAGSARVLSAQSAGEFIEGTTSFVKREPLGVVAGITPWNYPLWQAVWKILPALATGNSVVVKPAEMTPLTTVRFAELASKHLPAGVLNVVNGYGSSTGSSLINHSDINLISFTGSVTTGRAIARAAAEGPKRTILELGGNAPVVVLDDADLENTAEEIVGAGLWNSGQECMAATRILAHASVAEELTTLMIKELEKVVVGDAANDKTTLGPLISEKQRDRVESLLNGRSPQSKIEFGGGRPDLPGYFIEPTLVSGLAADEELVQEEIFGPVMTLQTFESDEEALELANGVRFGLAGSVWTNDVKRGLAFVNALDFGNVWINTHLAVGPDLPIGGFNESGYGKEGSQIGAEEFTRIKQIGIKH